MNDEKPVEVGYLVNGEIITEEQYKSQQRERFNGLSQMFAKQRDDWVAYRNRSGVEKRWKDSRALYLGDDEDASESALVNTLKNGPTRRGTAAQPARSRVVVNIVRPKVDQAIARMCEILLPVDDRNWGIKPTPVPESVGKLIGSQEPLIDPRTGQSTGMTGDQAYQLFVKKMKDAASKMANEIDDVLTECGYNGEQRKAIEDGVILGSACLLGPFPQNNAKRRWVPIGDGRMQLEITNEPKPASMRVDPWDIFVDPACGNDHHRGAGFYHRRFVTRKELRDLVDIPGYDRDAIRQVLSGKPTRLKAVEGRVQRDPCDEDSYEMWVYYGEVEPDHMAFLGECCGDPLEDVGRGMLVMVDNTIIGATELWTVDGSMPLDIWCWRDADDSPFGYSLPHELAHQSRVVIAAWRQVMDNAKVAVGGQIIMKKKGVQPQNNSYVIEPLKVWLADDDIKDVREAMGMVEFASHLTELLAIAESAMKFADQETSMPQIMGGEKGTAPETVGGMIMLYNNSNVVLRLRVKRYDDKITRKQIGRHYDWQMANNHKPEIKGDMEVDARGSTALLEKDIQNQATLNLANVTSNPRYQAFIDPKEELKVVLKAFRIQPEDIMLSDDKIEENLKAAAENPPTDPDALKAQTALQVKQMDLQDRAEDRAFQERKQAAELGHKQAALAYNADREDKEYQIAMTEAQLTRMLALMKLASEEGENEAERSLRERLEAIQIDSKHQLFNAEAALRVNTGEGI